MEDKNNIVDFARFKEQDADYITQLDDCVRALTLIEEELSNQAVNLATRGAWKDWNDQMQEGEIFQFSDEMLHDTGDPIVSEVMKIKESVSMVIEQIGDKLD